ncbi:MAG: iron uptake transporter deferrochelatase/peroxidase subunit [Burkholderiales bacterium]|jgi:deferrochelatase/peroxidase EfeB|nr:iron uptake transporter deferrochelatase/peroxidase subunit [Burkholderiales bacterium]
MMKSDTQNASALSRRSFLKSIGGSSVGLALGGGLGLAACTPKSSTQNFSGDYSAMAQQNYPFYGAHQAGIVTPAQRAIYFLVLDLHTQDIEEIKAVFKQWTESAAKLTRGENIQPYGDNPFVPPVDTGEADGLGAYGLTLTFGVSPAFLQKLGLSAHAPSEFVDLPLFPRDQIKPEFSGGDICIQSCADDPQTAFHAVRQLVRQARSSVTMKWSQSGFNAFDHSQHTPRNLFGFKDGTANQETLKNADQHVWVNTPNWLAGGSYLVVRKIQTHLETWDRTSLKGQEETFGRIRHSGAPMGAQAEFDHADIQSKDANGNPVIPDNSHMGLAKKTGLQILRRSFSFSSGIDLTTGQFDAGLLFISFQKSPAQFIALQSAFGRMDRMNEYITHTGSGLFACFGGVQEGAYIGQALLENQRTG